MTDKQKIQKTEDTFKQKHWLGDYDDYPPYGYNLEDEFARTPQEERQMYDEAVRRLRAQINAKREQKKSGMGNKNV